MLAIIAAYAKNRVIGKEGRIPWNIKGEQSRFRELTTGNVVIMGRRTYEEIGHPLPNRDTIVVSTTKRFEAEHCRTAASLQEAIRMAGNRDIFVSGGAALYREALPYADRLYLTEIEAEVEGDTYFPEFEESRYEKKIDQEVFGELPYRYVTYERKAKQEGRMKAYYQNFMYGQWRSGEKVTYEIKDNNEVTIRVEKDGRSTEFTVTMFLPEESATAQYPAGSPFIISMHPIQPKDYALSKGYAVFFMNVYAIASDNMEHKGCFYDLYPYGSEPESQTGALMAWAWGASKVLDAVYAGLGAAAGLDVNGAMVTGVSRFGKATAVCGAFDERFKMTIPACSGAGGLALYDVVSKGNTYDFSSVGGPSEYTYGENEPLSCLQSEAERGWFNDKFLDFKTPEEIPVGQEQLPILAAAPDRYYFIIAAYTGEDWVNAPAMWECYKKAEEYYAKQGLSDHLAVHFHLVGHAVLEEDMKLLIDYFNHMQYGMETDIAMDELKKTVFAE